MRCSNLPQLVPYNRKSVTWSPSDLRDLTRDQNLITHLRQNFLIFTGMSIIYKLFTVRYSTNYHRAGVGLIVKGLDDAVVNMHVGDRYHLVFGGDLAFGEKGKPSAPGKPRIPPNAAIDYEVLLFLSCTNTTTA